MKFENTLHLSEPAHRYLADYSLLGRTTFPAGAQIEMCLAAGRAVLGTDKLVLSRFNIMRALPLNSLQPCQLQVRVDAAADSAYDVLICKSKNSGGDVIARATVSAGHDKQKFLKEIDSAQLAAALVRDPTVFYQELSLDGMETGRGFQVLARLRTGPFQAHAEIGLPEGNSGSGYACHPALLEGGFQTCASLLMERKTGGGVVYMPASVDQLVHYRSLGDRVSVHAYLDDSADAREFCARANLTLFDANSGEVCAELRGILFREMDRHDLRSMLESAERVPNLFYEMAWRKSKEIAPLQQDSWRHSVGESDLSGNETAPTWLILADDSGVGFSLARDLRASGESVLIASAARPGEDLEQHHISWSRNQGDLAKLIAGIDNNRIAGVVHCWSLDTKSGVQTELEDAQLTACGSVLELVQVLFALKGETRPKLFLLTQGAQVLPGQSKVEAMQSPLVGLSRVIATEHPELGCRLIDLDPDYQPGTAAERVIAELRIDDAEEQVAWRQDCRYVARLVRQSKTHYDTLDFPSGSYELVGVKQHPYLQLKEKRHTDKPLPGQVEVAICATGITLNDVTSTLDKHSLARSAIGLEFAGVVTAVSDEAELRPGDPVFGVGSQAFTDRLITSAELVIRKPEGLSFEEAAALPAAFLTAYGCLCDFAQLQAGTTVLVCTNSDGIGLMAIQIAMKFDATVYATASDSAQRAYLERLGVSHVFDEKSTSIVHDVMRLTAGAGVDIVLNAGTRIPNHDILNAVKDGGFFVELNQRDGLTADEVAQAYPFIRYKIFSLKELIDDARKVRAYLEILIDWYERGQLVPPTVQCFQIQQAPHAFQTIKQSSHAGKIVLASLNGKRCKRFRTDRTYIVTGGLGGLGLEVCEWLIDYGAGNIAVLNRRPPSESARARIRKWEARGARVHIYSTDVGDHRLLAQTLETIRCELPPMIGLFHLAGVLSDKTLTLSDAMLANQDWQSFQQVFRAKVYGSWFLHQLTLQDELEYFVLFSSASSSIGSMGLGDYASANSFLDALAYLRRNHGLPGLSINWGMWSDKGMAVQLSSKSSSSLADMTFPLAAGLQALSTLVCDPEAVNVGFATDATFFHQNAGAHRLLLSELPSGSQQSSSSDAAPRSELLELAARLDDAWTTDQVSLSLRRYIEDHVRDVLNWPAQQSLHARDHLFELGMDSLMAMELANRFNRDLGRRAVLAAPAVYGHPTIEELSHYLASELKALSTRGKS